MEALKKTGYEAHTVVLGSRDQLCCNQDVLEAVKGQALNQKCAELVHNFFENNKKLKDKSEIKNKSLYLTASVLREENQKREKPEELKEECKFYSKAYRIEDDEHGIRMSWDPHTVKELKKIGT